MISKLKVRFAINVVVLFILTSVAYSEPLGLRDYTLGVKKSELAKIESMYCGARNTCILKNYIIKDVSVNLLFMFDKSESVNSIGVFYKRMDYSKIFAALVEKWGEPTSEEKKIWQNMRGDKLDNKVSTWSLPDGTITAAYIDNKIDESSVIISNAQAINDFIEKRNEAKKLPGF